MDVTAVWGAAAEYWEEGEKRCVGLAERMDAGAGAGGDWVWGWEEICDWGWV